MDMDRKLSRWSLRILSCLSTGCSLDLANTEKHPWKRDISRQLELKKQGRDLLRSITGKTTTDLSYQKALVWVVRGKSEKTRNLGTNDGKGKDCEPLILGCDRETSSGESPPLTQFGPKFKKGCLRSPPAVAPS